MKNVLLLFVLGFALFWVGCEKEVVIPEEDTKEYPQYLKDWAKLDYDNRPIVNPERSLLVTDEKVRSTNRDERCCSPIGVTNRNVGGCPLPGGTCLNLTYSVITPSFNLNDEPNGLTIDTYLNGQLYTTYSNFLLEQDCSRVGVSIQLDEEDLESADNCTNVVEFGVTIWTFDEGFNRYLGCSRSITSYEVHGYYTGDEDCDGPIEPNPEPCEVSSDPEPC